MNYYLAYTIYNQHNYLSSHLLVVSNHVHQNAILYPKGEFILSILGVTLLYIYIYIYIVYFFLYYEIFSFCI